MQCSRLGEGCCERRLPLPRDQRQDRVRRAGAANLRQSSSAALNRFVSPRSSATYMSASMSSIKRTKNSSFLVYRGKFSVRYVPYDVRFYVLLMLPQTLSKLDKRWLSSGHRLRPPNNSMLVSFAPISVLRRERTSSRKTPVAPMIVCIQRRQRGCPIHPAGRP